MASIWKLNDAEFKKVTALPADTRFSYFVKRIADREILWGLRNDDGWVTASTNEGQVMFPVWPHPKYAQACAVGEWADCKPAEISLDAWLERWLPGLEKDGRGIAVFPAPSQNGAVVSPQVLGDAIQEALAELE